MVKEVKMEEKKIIQAKINLDKQNALEVILRHFVISYLKCFVISYSKRIVYLYRVLLFHL